MTFTYNLLNAKRNYEGVEFLHIVKNLETIRVFSQTRSRTIENHRKPTERAMRCPDIVSAPEISKRFSPQLIYCGIAKYVSM